jgi:hypothetical protein
VSTGDQLKQIGWRQGEFVPAETHQLFDDCFKSIALPTGYRLLVCSQTCDIINPSDVEEFVEVLICYLPTFKGSCHNGSHPRILQFEAKSDIGIITFEVNQNLKLRVDRDLFLKCKPDDGLSLSKKTVSVVADWLAARYNRPAFPNAFEKLIKPSESKQHKKIKQISKKISGLYIALQPDGEISDGEKYFVALLATYPIQEEKNRYSKEMTEPIEALVDLMKGCGMDVDYQILSEEKANICLLRDYKKWSYDDISYKQDDPKPVAY